LCHLHCVHEIHLEMCPQSSFKLTLMATHNHTMMLKIAPLHQTS
jgi:NAD-dependent dihydropyrimidine dehydrogenase PreA subunit